MGAAPATSRDCGGAVYVFYDQVAGFSNVQRMDSALVLGTVIAHEIGHLLLRHGHSPEGLMRASWDSGDWQRASSGFLLFSPPEPTTIRATISSCRR
jgi:predicted Zn-dependent protease